MQQSTSRSARSYICIIQEQLKICIMFVEHHHHHQKQCRILLNLPRNTAERDFSSSKNTVEQICSLKNVTKTLGKYLEKH